MSRLLRIARLSFCYAALAADPGLRQHASVAGFHVILELDGLIPDEGFREKDETVKIKLMNADDFSTGRSDLVEDELRKRGYTHPKIQIGSMSSLRIANRHGKLVEPPPAGAASADDFPLDVQAVYVMNTIPDGAIVTGTIVIDVFPDWAPLGAARVRELVTGKAWELARFFRVVPGFVAQWGLPAKAAGGGAECAQQSIKDDVVSADGPWNTPFTVAFASVGPGTRSCQAFINYGNNGNLNGQVVPFGQVVKGFRVAERLSDKYGEQPDHAEIRMHGNAYLDKNFPGLSHIKAARVVEGPFPRDRSKTPERMYEEEMAAAGIDVSALKKDEL